MAVFASSLLSILAVEFVLRLFFPVPDPFEGLKQRPDRVPQYIPSSFPPDLRLIPVVEPGLSGMRPGAVQFSTNNVGFRGDSLATPKPSNEFRVFVVGGSTTECFYLDDQATMPADLERRLQRVAPSGRVVRVYNAGKSADKSYDHVAMLAQRIAHLAPDLVVVFAGVNDLRAQLTDSAYWFVRPRRPDDDWSNFALLKLASTELQIVRRLYTLLHRAAPLEEVTQVRLTSEYAHLAAVARAAPLGRSSLVIPAGPYRENLESIVGIAEARHVPIVLLTQATTWNSAEADSLLDRHWMTFFGKVRYDEAALDNAMESLNDVTRDVTAQHHLPLVDLARDLPKSRRFFYDDVHFNAAGADTAAALIAKVARVR